MLKGRLTGFSIACIISLVSFSQQSVKKFNPDSLTAEYFNALKKEFGYRKQIPTEFERQILVALSYYPELKNVSITFRIRQRHAIAMTRSTWTSIFSSPGSRRYVITISDSTETLLMPVLLSRQAFNSQVGILGHELGHVIQYADMNAVKLARYAIANVSPKYVDRFEFGADAICIDHGLGYQLLEWSSFVRTIMKRENWRGPDYVRKPGNIERYMNPSTILNRIAKDRRYDSVR